MSKQRVKMTKVEMDIVMQKDEKYGGGQYAGSRITFEQTVDGKTSTEVKPLHSVHLEKNPALRAQLQALSTASLPVEVVLERTTQTLPGGKSYEAITAVLPKTTPILPEEEFKPKAFRSFSKGSTYSPKATALNAASRLGGSAEEVIANAKLFEAYLAEDKKQESSADSRANSAESKADVSNDVKYEF